ncbi:MAG: DUF2279 domain-containing protein [Kofleriaceae bacterium]
MSRLSVIAAVLSVTMLTATAHADDDREPPSEPNPTGAWLTLGGAYAVFGGWMYVAWYRNHRDLADFKWGGDGWLGSTTYAGGADKFGHAWATMSLARGGTELLHQWGGYSMLKSSLIATAMSEALFIGVEVRDGFTFEFSFSDLTGDTVGALIALALSNFPRLDELFDYRVQYFPSSIYLDKLDGSSPCPTGGCSRWNIAEDYSGQTYLLAFHLGGIHALRDSEYGGWSRFVDVTAGFQTRDYKPPPDAAMNPKPRQDMFIGVSLNMQGVLDTLLSNHHTAKKITHGMFEIFNLPFTNLPVLEHEHHAAGAPATDGA